MSFFHVQSAFCVEFIIHRYKLKEAWAWGVLSPMTAGSVGRFVTNDCWKRGGVFYLFLTDFDVIEWEWAWGVL